MAYRQFRRKIYQIPFILLGCLLAFATALIILSILNFNYPNPIITSITSQLAQGAKEITTLIFGALIASLVGLYSSIAIMDLETEKIRDKIILGFYYEIKELSIIINNIPVDELNNCLRYLTLHRKPIYTDNGLYFVLKAELFLLDKNMLEKILDLYPKIIFIEEDRKNLEKPAPTADLHLLEIIQDTQNKINELLQILDAEVKDL